MKESKYEVVKRRITYVDFIEERYLHGVPSYVAEENTGNRHVENYRGKKTNKPNNMEE